MIKPKKTQERTQESQAKDRSRAPLRLRDAFDLIADRSVVAVTRLGVSGLLDLKPCNSLETDDCSKRPKMGRFHPVYIRRSDGMLETATKNGARIQKEANKPTPKQLDDKPKPDGVKDYYREVAIDESKHMDWRRKLAAMLARDIGLDPGVFALCDTKPRHY